MSRRVFILKQESRYLDPPPPPTAIDIVHGVFSSFAKSEPVRQTLHASIPRIESISQPVNGTNTTSNEVYLILDQRGRSVLHVDRDGCFDDKDTAIDYFLHVYLRSGVIVPAEWMHWAMRMDENGLPWYRAKSARDGSEGYWWVAVFTIDEMVPEESSGGEEGGVALEETKIQTA